MLAYLTLGQILTQKRTAAEVASLTADNIGGITSNISRLSSEINVKEITIFITLFESCRFHIF